MPTLAAAITALMAVPPSVQSSVRPLAVLEVATTCPDSTLAQQVYQEQTMEVKTATPERWTTSPAEADPSLDACDPARLAALSYPRLVQRTLRHVLPQHRPEPLPKHRHGQLVLRNFGKFLAPRRERQSTVKPV